MKCSRKRIHIVGAMALATVITTSAFAQMGGGGMMGGDGRMGRNGLDSRNENVYRPDTNGVQRDAPHAPDANRSEPSDELDLGPLDQLNMNRQQFGEITIIREEFRDHQSNARRRLKVEQARLRELYDSPKRHQAIIDSQFRHIERLRREIFESSVNARDRIAAQLTAQQQQRLHRIAPRWNAGG